MFEKKEEKERRLFFTSDIWFYRENAIGMLGRKYGGVDEMNQDLIDKWNTTVGEDDVVFILGNYVYDPTKMEIINSVLRGVKVLLPTEFDKGAIMKNNEVITTLLTGETTNFFGSSLHKEGTGELSYDWYIKHKAYDSVGLGTSDSCFSVLKAKIESDTEDFIVLHNNIVELPDYGLVVSHYPLMDWNGKAQGTMHFHGGNTPTAKSLRTEKRFNVSADLCGMTPVSYNNIVKIISKSK